MDTNRFDRRLGAGLVIATIATVAAHVASPGGPVIAAIMALAPPALAALAGCAFGCRFASAFGRSNVAAAGSFAIMPLDPFLIPHSRLALVLIAFFAFGFFGRRIIVAMLVSFERERLAALIGAAVLSATAILACIARVAGAPLMQLLLGFAGLAVVLALADALVAFAPARRAADDVIGR